jgi:hypothetical protein
VSVIMPSASCPRGVSERQNGERDVASRCRRADV